MPRGRTPPTLRLHARGTWFSRFAGRDFYFTRDEAASRREFLDPQSTHPGALVAWLAWQDRKRLAAPPRPDQRLRTAELVERFLATYEDEGRDDTARYFRKHLKRFNGMFGAILADTINAEALQAFRTDLLTTTHIARGTDEARRLGPKTIAHDLIAVKTLWRWAARMDLVRPIELSVIRAPRTRRGEPQVRSREQITTTLRSLKKSHPQLVPWLAVAYLALLRPSETFRIMSRAGRFEAIRDDTGPPIERGLFQLSTGKSEWITGEPRTVILTDEALLWLEQSPPPTQARPLPWSTPAAFSKAASAACGASFGPPSVLRDSAASHLLAKGVPLESVSLLLGHVPRGEWRSYGRPGWRVLRERAALLSGLPV